MCRLYRLKLEIILLDVKTPMTPKRYHSTLFRLIDAQEPRWAASCSRRLTRTRLRDQSKKANNPINIHNLTLTSLSYQKRASFQFQSETQPSSLFLEGAWFTVQNISTFFSEEKTLGKFQFFLWATSTCSFIQLVCNTGHRQQLLLPTGNTDNIDKPIK